MGHKTASAHGCATHTKPQGFIIRPPLLTTNKAFLRSVDQKKKVTIAPNADDPPSLRGVHHAAEADRPGALVAVVHERSPPPSPFPRCRPFADTDAHIDHMLN